MVNKKIKINKIKNFEHANSYELSYFNFLFFNKNNKKIVNSKKGLLSNLVKFLLWAAFVGVVLIGVYFLGNKLGIGI